MAVFIKRIKVDNYNQIEEVEFYPESQPRDVLIFLHDFKIGLNFRFVEVIEQNLKNQADATQSEVSGK